jgi:NADH dehydrogenase
MRILVLGAGYAGVTLARRLESLLPSEADVLVVNDAETHLVQHEVHRVIRRPSVADAICVPLSAVFDRAEPRVARVESVDRGAREVRLEGGESLSYDYAAVCLGAETAHYGLPGVEGHSHPLKRVEDALAIRDAVFEAAATADRVRIVVGGAGLSGVQTAGELAALAREEEIDADVTILERLGDVAPAFPPNFRAAVRAALEERGVDVRTGTTVVRAAGDAVETAEGTVPSDVFVWTGGIGGAAAMGGDRPVVRSDLRLDDRTFAVGDAARVVDADGEAVPASASAAIREARAAATNISRLVEHELDGGGGFAPRLEPYRFDVPGWIVSVGDGAVAQLGPTVLTGAPAKALKTSVGAGHLASVGAIRNAAELAEAELGE